MQHHYRFVALAGIVVVDIQFQFAFLDANKPASGSFGDGSHLDISKKIRLETEAVH